jgi:hypothetical protein
MTYGTTNVLRERVADLPIQPTDADHERARRILGMRLGTPLSAGDAAIDAIVETYQRDDDR